MSQPVRHLLALPGIPGPHVAFLTSYVALLLVQFLAPFHLTRVLEGLHPVHGNLAGPASRDRGRGSGQRRSVGPPRPPPDRGGGAAVGTGALLLLLPLSPDWAPVDLAWRLGVLGAGFGLFVTPNMATAMAIAPPDGHGLVAVTTNLSRLLGLSLGPAAATVAWALSGYPLGACAPAWRSPSSPATPQGAPTAPQAPPSHR